MNKKAQEQIITTVLLILIVLAAVVIVWAVIQRFVIGGTKTVTTTASCFDTKFSIDESNTVCNATTDKIIVLVNRNPGDTAGNISVRLIVVNNTDTKTSKDDVAPTVLGTKLYTLSNVPASTDEMVTIRVAPLIGESPCAPVETQKKCVA